MQEGGKASFFLVLRGFRGQIEIPLTLLLLFTLKRRLGNKEKILQLSI